jgi:hypothetical protein
VDYYEKITCLRKAHIAGLPSIELEKPLSKNIDFLNQNEKAMMTYCLFSQTYNLSPVLQVPHIYYFYIP